MTTRFPVGARVRVRRDRDYGPGPWPQEPTGTVEAYHGGDPFIVRRTLKGDEHAFWVAFDEAQTDADGDGPYCKAEILARYLEPEG